MRVEDKEEINVIHRTEFRRRKRKAGVKQWQKIEVPRLFELPSRIFIRPEHVKVRLIISYLLRLVMSFRPDISIVTKSAEGPFRAILVGPRLALMA